MRVPALSMLLIAFAFLLAGCAGGPDDGDASLAEACKRQMEEVAEDEGSTPTAKSSQDKAEDETLVECAGQKVKLVPGEGEKQASEKDDTKDTGEPTKGGGEEKPAALDPAARELFAKTCGGCHTLSDAKTTGSVGPDLDELTLDAETVRNQIDNGGGGMPPALLSGQDADDVAAYVAGASEASKK